MNKKILKISIVVLLLVLMTTPNFIFVGVGLVSYAVDGITTNNQNIEFDANIIDKNTLSLSVNVKKEGYFNGEISIENSNFIIESGQQNQFVSKIENNKIILNQINAGTNAQIDLKIQPIKDEMFDIGLLNKTSSVNISGIYRDSTEKDISVNSTREVKFEYEDTNNNENIEASSRVITNKIINVSGEDKRVIQLEMNLGLKENNYPIKEIEVDLDVPVVNGKGPSISSKIDFNTMTHYDINYENNSEKSRLNLKFTNEPNKDNKIRWKKDGSEKVVLTFLYDKDTKIEDYKYKAVLNDFAAGEPITKVTLYSGKELSNIANLRISDLNEKENQEEIVNVVSINKENSIYKGKIYAGIDRQFESITKLEVNLANAENEIDIKENTEKSIFNKTLIKKDSFDKILGENGTITLLNESSQVIAIVDKSTQANENGYIEIDFNGKEPSILEIKTTTPIKEGNIEFINTKTIKGGSRDTFKDILELKTNIIYRYNDVQQKENKTTLKLEETKTEIELLLNKETLSTVVENELEIKAILKASNEQEDLYSNPIITFELPEDVENININSINLMYENGLKVLDYKVEGRTIIIRTEGRQITYDSSSIEGTVVVVNSSIRLNKKASTKDCEITMKCSNNGVETTDSKNIKIIAPRSITAVYGIKDLNIETTGDEETKKVEITRGTVAKQYEADIEIINNNENEINNIKVLGTFPTNSTNNNMGITIKEKLNIENTKIYYTEKEDATDDLEKAENKWKEDITDFSNVKKYLITIPKIDVQSSIKGTYKFEIPELLEYNQNSSLGYIVKYTNSLTNTESEMKSTNILLETGVGPVLEVKLSPIVGTTQLKENDTVKTGEVIKYNIEVSNTGSEDIQNIDVSAKIPDGTALVRPEKDYEYSGNSYYEELQDKTYEAKIEKLSAGSTLSGEYEVRVMQDAEAGTVVKNSAEIKYGDVIKKSEESSLKIEKGNIRLTVKRITDRRINLYDTSSVRYFAIVENLSNNKEKNVLVKTDFSDNIKIDNVTLLNHMENYKEEEGKEIDSKNLKYSDSMNIGTLEAGEIKILSYDAIANNEGKQNDIKLYVTAESGNMVYRSNVIKDYIINANITLNMTTNVENQYVKSGDIIEYVITVKNNEKNDIKGLTIFDEIPDSLSVEKVMFDDKEIQELKGSNDIEIICNLKAESESTIRIQTAVKYLIERTSSELITNSAYAEISNKTIATTNDITHIIQVEDQLEDESDKPEGEKETEEPQDGEKDADEPDKKEDDETETVGNSIITGLAWFDKNANGQKDNDEKVLSNVTVKLLNTQTNNYEKDEDGNIVEAKTNDKGIYLLEHIKNGKYIVIFDYDKTKYSLTKYKVENVDESKNSNAISNELLVDGQKQQLASTDIIEINNNNVSHINVGLVELKDFSFRLDKYVKKIIVQNSTGTTVKEYTDATIAKAELDGKKINGTTVIIEYEIKVTNIGEVDGYVRKIVDYVPSDLKFSSELNKDWYQTKNELYNSSLSNDVIKAGQSKTIKLTLTKAMTENNTGLINNTAEIAESYNELGIKDSKSTSGNKAKGEADYGSADAILSIKTGGEVYIITIIIVLGILGTVGFLVIKNKKGKNQ